MSLLYECIVVQTNHVYFAVKSITLFLHKFSPLIRNISFTSESIALNILPARRVLGANTSFYWEFAYYQHIVIIVMNEIIRKHLKK